MGFLCGSAGKDSTCKAEDLDLIPGLGRSPEEGKGYPFQYSGLEDSMDCVSILFIKNPHEGEKLVREFEMDMYTLLHLKWVTNKDLELCSMLCDSLDGGEFGGNGYMYMNG